MAHNSSIPLIGVSINPNPIQSGEEDEYYGGKAQGSY